MATEEFVDGTIAALKIIGMVPKSGKLCVRKGQLSLDICDKSQGLRRWANGDSRDVTLMHARNTINSAVKISKALIANAAATELAQWTLQRLAAEMEQCDVGLQNLKTTYSCDSMMVANLDVLSDRLRAHHSEVRRFLDADAAQLAAQPLYGAQQANQKPRTRHGPCADDAPPS